MATSFITNTASLKTTIADVRKLNAKKIFVGGENILDIIKNATPTIAIKHANDTRTTVTENDLWGQWIETLEDGTIIIHDDWVTNPNRNAKWNGDIVKVENNKAYTGEIDFYGNLSNLALCANIQTEKLKNGTYMFNCCNKLTTFNSDLSSLTDGRYMFSYCSNLINFYSDLSSISNGHMMFRACSKLTNFNSDSSGSPVNLRSLTNGYEMFDGCSNLKTFTSDLSSLTNGYRMFGGCNNLTTFTSYLSSLSNGYRMFCGCNNLTNFTSDLSSLDNGYCMFASCSNLTTLTSDLSSLNNGKMMFAGCSNLKTFYSDLNSLTYGGSMFSDCDNLTTFTSDLGSLNNGKMMFAGCSNLTTFDSDLSSLVNAEGMFGHCSKLTNFNSDLSSLTYGYGMLYGCTALTAFTNDLSSLINGRNMFDMDRNLTTFTSDLSSLTYGGSMFSQTKLSPQSVMYIVDSIKDIVAEKKLYQDGTIPYVTLANGKYSSTKGFMSDGKYVYTYNNPQPYTTTISVTDVGQITIGINVTNNSSTIADQLQTFAEEATFDSWEDLKQAFVDKGWSVSWQYGGTNTDITYDMRGERIIPCPVYAQLVEIFPEGVELDEEGNQVGEKFYTDEQKKQSSYTNEEGTKFYSINWGHDVTNYDDFQQFDSIEDAAAQMRLKKIGEVEIESA